MDKNFLKTQEEKLEKSKKSLENQLASFAKRSKVSKKDWQTSWPQLDGGLEEEADEVEEYTTLLPQEYALEIKLRDVNLALEKIQNPKKGLKYGFCEKCKKEISKERLEAIPEARTCAKCK